MRASRKTGKKRISQAGLASIFRALSAEARICIIKELSSGEEICVQELVGCCGLGWSTVSHHLSILREAGIVTDEKRGQQVFYRLALPCVTHFIRCLERPSCEPTLQSAVCCN